MTITVIILQLTLLSSVIITIIRGQPPPHVNRMVFAWLINTKKVPHFVHPKKFKLGTSVTINITTTLPISVTITVIITTTLPVSVTITGAAKTLHRVLCLWSHVFMLSCCHETDM